MVDRCTPAPGSNHVSRPAGVALVRHRGRSWRRPCLRSPVFSSQSLLDKPGYILRAMGEFTATHQPNDRDAGDGIDSFPNTADFGQRLRGSHIVAVGPVLSRLHLGGLGGRRRARREPERHWKSYRPAASTASLSAW